MVDYDSYFQYGPADGRNGALQPSYSDPPCVCSDCQNNTGLISRSRAWLDDSKTSQSRSWKPEQYLLCPPRVLGYILKEKRWAQLQVTHLEVLTTYQNEEAYQLFEPLRLADDLTEQKKAALKKQGKSGKSSHSSSSDVLICLQCYF